MKTNYFFTFLLFFLGTGLSINAQVTIQVNVKSISVASAIDCDAADNSDFVFEYKVQDNSPSAFSNNAPVAGSIGMCNYVVVNEHNGPFVFTPAAPGSAVFSPTTGVFFNRSYNCRNEIPTTLTLTWAAYENDDAGAPSVTPVADGTISSQVTTYTVPNSNGTYTSQFSLTSSDGACPQTYTIEFEVQKSVGSFSPLMINFTDAHEICTGANNGVLEASVSGGSGTVLSDWSFDGLGDYDDNATHSGVGAGTYTFVVKDNLNCTDTSIVTLEEVDPPVTFTLFTSSTPTVCSGQSGVLYEVPFENDVTYNWSYSVPGAIINGSGNSVTVDFLNSAGSGILSVYAANSCSTTPTLTMAITVLQSPTISISGNTSICDNVQEVLTASGATTYTWSTGANTASTVITPTTATIYTVTGSAANGCMGLTQHSVTVMISPTVQVTGSTLAVCPNETVAVSASGNGDLYIWSDGFFGMNHTVKAQNTTVFTITNTYTNNGCYTQATYTLNVMPGPLLSIAGNTIVCEAITVSLTASGADSYAWSDGITTYTNTFVPTSTTTLVLVGELLNGCKDSISQIIKLVNTPTVTITGTDTICEGESAVLAASANGTVNYGWNSGQNTQTITVSPTGTFTYNVVADNGACTGTASHEVFVKLIPSLDFELDNLYLCYDSPLYTFTASPIGGTYSGTGVSGNTFDPSVSPGNYSITYSVSFSNGCSAVETQTLEVWVCMGISDQETMHGVSVFPNPAASDVIIKSVNEIETILMYDFTGKLVRVIQANAFETTIDINALAKGLYTLSIVTKDKSQKSVKVVKE